jgi:hypothetical protein
MSFPSILWLGLLTIRLVSSANNIILQLPLKFILSGILGKSLIKIRNNKGPRTDPWGTP